jgi:hypothetical protein
MHFSLQLQQVLVVAFEGDGFMVVHVHGYVSLSSRSSFPKSQPVGVKSGMRGPFQEEMCTESTSRCTRQAFVFTRKCKWGFDGIPVN